MRIFLFVVFCAVALSSCASHQSRQEMAATISDLENDVILIARVIEVKEMQPGSNAGFLLDLLVKKVLDDGGSAVVPGDRILVQVPSLQNLVMEPRLSNIPVTYGYYLVSLRDTFDWDYCGRLNMWEWVGIEEGITPIRAVVTVLRVQPSPMALGAVVVTARIEKTRIYYGKQRSLGNYIEVHMSCLEAEISSITTRTKGESKVLYIDPSNIWGMWNTEPPLSE